MTRAELIEYIDGRGFDEVLILEPEYFDAAIVGITEDGRLVYSYEALAEAIVENDGGTIEEAMEFIDYNTVRSLPYEGEKAPIITYKIEI